MMNSFFLIHYHSNYLLFPIQLIRQIIIHYIKITIKTNFKYYQFFELIFISYLNCYVSFIIYINKNIKEKHERKYRYQTRLNSLICLEGFQRGDKSWGLNEFIDFRITFWRRAHAKSGPLISWYEQFSTTIRIISRNDELRSWWLHFWVRKCPVKWGARTTSTK